MVKHTFYHQVEPLISGCYSNHFQRVLWLFWILSLYYHLCIFIFISNMIWLVVRNIFYFPYIGNNHPNWLSHFSEGLKPPTSDPTLFFFSDLARRTHRRWIWSTSPQRRGTDAPIRWSLHVPSPQKNIKDLLLTVYFLYTCMCLIIYIYVLYLCMIDVDIPEPDTKSNRW